MAADGGGGGDGSFVLSGVDLHIKLSEEIGHAHGRKRGRCRDDGTEVLCMLERCSCDARLRSSRLTSGIGRGSHSVSHKLFLASEVLQVAALLMWSVL